MDQDDREALAEEDRYERDLGVSHAQGQHSPEEPNEDCPACLFLGWVTA